MNWNEYFYYDETSPSCLRWKVKRYCVNKGDQAGSINSRGRYIVKLLNNSYLVHRIIFEMFFHELGCDDLVDHANRNCTDNRIENLRCCSASKNAMNRGVISSYVKYKGIDFNKGKYRARIKINGKSTHIGYFDSAEEAAMAYDIKALEIFGEFATLNFSKQKRERLSPLP